jgi:enoyl-CoA hydratase
MSSLPSFATLLVTLEAPLAIVTINRPQVLNALNAQVFDDLEQAFLGLAADASVRAILLTGAGEKAGRPSSPGLSAAASP